MVGEHGSNCIFKRSLSETIDYSISTGLLIRFLLLIKNFMNACVEDMFKGVFMSQILI